VVRLNVLAFAYVGGGAFVAAMNETLHELVLDGKLDDVFPQVAQWTAGRFGYELCRSHFDIDIYQNMRDPDFASFVPSSAQYIRVSERTLFVVEPEVHVPIFESVTIGSATNVAQMTALTCYQSLTALTIVCNQPINASDLPRGLILFTCTYGSTIPYGRRVDNTWHPFLFTDAPIGLEHLRLHSRHDLVLAEDVPFKAPSLKTLDVQHLRDETYQLSASTLPTTLTSLGICNMRVDNLATPLEEKDDLYLLDQHLFHNIQSNAWVDVWPTQLQLKYTNFTNQNGFGNLLDRFALLVHVPACLYTLRHLLTDAAYFELDKVDAMKKQFSIPKLDFKQVLRRMREYGWNTFLMLRGEFLTELNDKLRGRIDSSEIDMSLTSISVTANPNEMALQLFALHNLPKLCHSLSSLQCEGFHNDAIIIPSWVRDLTLDSYPHQLINTTSSETGLPLEVTSTDLIESIRIALLSKPITEHGVEYYPPRFVNDEMPRFLLQLPCRLVSLDISLMTREIDVISKHLREWTTFLPKTLQYFRLRPARHEWSTRFKEENFAAVLPPGLRLLDWSAFAVKHRKLGSFCKEVAAIPSLNRLIVVFNYVDPPGVVCIPVPYYQSWHCHSKAKTFSDRIDPPPPQFTDQLPELPPSHQLIEFAVRVLKMISSKPLLLRIMFALVPFVLIWSHKWFFSND
jgi:hypothetical protein